MDYCDLDAWEFGKYDDLGWAWHRVKPNGELRAASRRSFAMLQDCVEDAACYGFGAPSIDHEDASDGAYDAVRAAEVQHAQVRA